MSEQSKSRFILVFLREEGTGITSFGRKSKGGARWVPVESGKSHNEEHMRS